MTALMPLRKEEDKGGVSVYSHQGKAMEGQNQKKALTNNLPTLAS